MHASSRFAHFLSYCLLHPTLLVGITSKVTQKVRRRLLRRSSAILDSCVEQQHLRAKTWCSTHAVNIADLSRHLPFPFVALRVEEIYSDYITGALLRSRTCPDTVGGSANLDLLFSLARSISARRIVETGVAFGWSSLALLLAIADRERDSIVCSVDLPYLRHWTTPWVGAAVPESLHFRWRVFRMADRQGLPKALQAAYPVDFAHYDSDKSTSGRLYGYSTIWRSLRGGGILVSDDVGDNLAFKEFAEMVERAPIVVEYDGKFQGILVK